VSLETARGRKFPIRDACSRRSSFRASGISRTAVYGPWMRGYPLDSVVRMASIEQWPGRRAQAALPSIVLATAALAATLIVLGHGGIPFTGVKRVDLDPLSGVLAACSALPVLFSRRAPMGAFLAATAASSVLAGLGYQIDLPIGPGAALYLVAASRDFRRPWRRWETAAVLAGLALFAAGCGLGDQAFPGGDLVHAGLTWAVAWFAGERTRLGREHIAELTERARRAEQDAERDRRLAVAEERARIARDLHDTAGHAINVIAVQASVGRLRFHQDPERARVALEAIEDVARQTAGEVDYIVSSLREADPPGAAPLAPAGIASIDALIAHHAAAGLAVTVSRPPGHSRTVSHVIDQAAYRIIQEALTNAARHGTGQARVELTYGDGGLGLTVTNPVRPGAPASQPGGHGLIGMRERATLLAGTFTATRADGVFRLHAHLPYGHDGALT
jgi:signal transduction histidine kinase